MTPFGVTSETGGEKREKNNDFPRNLLAIKVLCTRIQITRIATNYRLRASH
jgi:hypothetical protein